MVGGIAGIAALFTFAALAYSVVAQATAPLDVAMLAWLHQLRGPLLDAAARGFSALGGEGTVVVLGILCGGLWLRGRRGAAVQLLVAAGGAWGLNSVLKVCFQRARPEQLAPLLSPQAFAFPSGHAMVAAAVYGFLVYLLWQRLRGWRRLAGLVAALLLVVLIGWARLYLGAHYPTDVVAGYLAGFAWVDTVLLGGHLLRRRRAPRLAPGPSPTYTP
ncbi:MAG TPA: phosphatase PAP2 family protein [Chloroflexota bacterium]|nr:phosphatase PAP2 family protein [Chloroflexota bacterium]